MNLLAEMQNPLTLCLQRTLHHTIAWLEVGSAHRQSETWTTHEKLHDHLCLAEHANTLNDKYCVLLLYRRHEPYCVVHAWTV